MVAERRRRLRHLRPLVSRQLLHRLAQAARRHCLHLALGVSATEPREHGFERRRVIPRPRLYELGVKRRALPEVEDEAGRRCRRRRGGRRRRRRDGAGAVAIFTALTARVSSSTSSCFSSAPPASLIGVASAVASAIAPVVALVAIGLDDSAHDALRRRGLRRGLRRRRLRRRRRAVHLERRRRHVRRVAQRSRTGAGRAAAAAARRRAAAAAAARPSAARASSRRFCSAQPVRATHAPLLAPREPAARVAPPHLLLERLAFARGLLPAVVGGGRAEQRPKARRGTTI